MATIPVGRLTRAQITLLATRKAGNTQLGANIRGIPVSFAIDGKQYVAIGAGFALFVFGLP